MSESNLPTLKESEWRAVLSHVIQSIMPYIHRLDHQAMLTAVILKELDKEMIKDGTFDEAVLREIALQDIMGESVGVMDHWEERTITEIQHKFSSSGNPTWYCKLDDGSMLYLGTTNGYAQQAKQMYPELEEMNPDNRDKWPANITVYVTRGDKFLELEKMLPGGTIQTPKTDQERQLRVAKAFDAVCNRNKFVTYDLETTGLDDDDEIVSIGIVWSLFAPDFYSTVCPSDVSKSHRKHEKTGKTAFDFHQIPDDKLKKSPTFPEVYERLKKHLNGTVVVYSGIDKETGQSFDKKTLDQVCRRHGLPVIEFNEINLMPYCAEYIGQEGKYGSYKWQTLEKAYEKITGKSLGNDAHNSLSDARATMEIAQAFRQLVKDSKPNHEEVPF